LDIFALAQNQMGYFLLIFARITGIFTSAPIFSSRNLPVQLKAALSLLCSVLIMPLFVDNHILAISSLLFFIIIVISEFLLGLLLGFAASLLFTAVEMAGNILDTQIGFGIVNIFDPQTAQQVPLIGNFKYILALLVYLSTNGHHIFLSAIFDSFKAVPVTSVVLQVLPITELFVTMISDAFIFAFKITIPILIALFLTDIALGILARTMPQMNIFVVGIPIKIIVGVFVLSTALPFFIIFLEVSFNAMYRDLYHLINILR